MPAQRYGTMHLTTAYKSSTNVDNYRYNGKNFRNKNIFENYFINKKESLFQIVLALNLTNFAHHSRLQPRQIF